MSAERACYPHTEKAILYPDNSSPFKYVNGGGWFCSSKVFIKAVELHPLTHDEVDQVWFTDLFLKHPEFVELDYNCEVFQTIAFCPESDFEIGERVRNTIHNTYPTFIHGNGHTPLTPFLKTLLPQMETLYELQKAWVNTEDSHKAIHDLFCDKVNAVPKLKHLRDYVEKNIFGFGERSFCWLFKLLVEAQPKDLSFLEIGVFRGQTLALIKTINPKASVTGVTPLDSTDGHWDSNYESDIATIHTEFNLPNPKIIKGLSMDEAVLNEVSKNRYDIIYIDGGHTYEVAKHDVFTYSSFVKVGGFLVIDDCANKYSMPGLFAGIASVSKAVDELLPNEYYKEICSVVHIRVFKRVK